MKGASNRYDFGQGITITKDSTQQASVSNLSGVAIPTKGTFYIWYRLTEYGALRISGGAIPLFVSGTSAYLTQSRFGVYLLNSSGIIYLVFETRTSGGVVVIAPQTIIPFDFKSHKIVLTYDSTQVTKNVTCYYDGSQLFIVNNSDIGLPATFLTTTNYRDTFNNISTGMVVGEDGIINGSVLSAADVTKFWNKNKGRDIDSIGSYTYVFKHKFNGNLTDSSGNSRDVAFSGSPAITYENFF